MVIIPWMIDEIKIGIDLLFSGPIYRLQRRMHQKRNKKLMKKIAKRRNGRVSR